MNWDSCPVVQAQIASRVVDGQAVIVLADSGQVQIFNEVGTRIWELIDGKRRAREIAAVIVEEFEVSSQEAERDVEAFLQELQQANIVVLQEHPPQ